MIRRKILNIPDIGEITLERKTGQKTIRLRIHPNTGIFVSIPPHISDNEAKKFALKNIDWLKDKISKINASRNQSSFNRDSVFISRFHRLQFDSDIYSGAFGKIEDNGLIRISAAEDVDLKKRSFQDFIEKIILNALQIEAFEYLPPRFSKLADTHGFRYKSLNIGKAGKILGSCKSSNDIRLSCRLMLLPDELIDYVILHELCHTIHKNHGPLFKELLNQCSNGKMKELERKLKAHSTKITPGNYNYS